METTLGSRMRLARRAMLERTGKEMTQAELGKRLGVEGATVSTWENDRYVPDLQMLLRIAAVLGVNPGWLAFGEGDRYPPLPSEP